MNDVPIAKALSWQEHPFFDSVATADASKELSTSGYVDGIPVIRVNLFGGFSVTRNGKPVVSPELNRQKVRSLLAMLVLCSGKEIDCSHAARILWPEGKESKNRHNYYNLWSLLRQGLALEDGSCPYIERMQNSCRVVERYVMSDVVLMDRLCDTLQYECGSVDEMLDTFRAISKLYFGELLPGEESNGIIVRKRWEWRNRIVDALFIGACCLYFRKEYAPATWFAQKATLVDPSREDVCQVLMQSQVAVGAKSAALQAYYNLAEVLKVNLAVAPSVSLSDYFEAVLMDDFETQEQIVGRLEHLTSFSPLREGKDNTVGNQELTEDALG